MHSNLAIIPARGGSKRIPRKNIKFFMGEPIIGYSIKIAIASGLFDEVMVSTDDKEIAAIALSYGASIPFMRSTKSSDDHATTMDVIQEVLTTYLRNEKTFSNVCCIYPTAPLIKKRHLEEGLSLLMTHKCKSVFPVLQYSYPVWRGVSINDAGEIKLVWPEYQHSRSQDLQVVYHDAGQWYWLDVAELSDSVFTDNSRCIVLSENEAQDIDTLSDWQIAELKYQLNNNSDR